MFDCNFVLFVTFVVITSLKHDLWDKDAHCRL